MKIAPVLAIALLFFAHPAAAGSEEEAIYASFEAFCLDHLTSQSDIARIAGALGLRQIPDSMKFPIFGYSPGNAWMSVGASNRFILALFDNGACGISAIDADGDGVAEVLKNNSRNQKIATDRIGTEISTMFAMTYPDRSGGPDNHALVMIQASSLKTIGAGVRITAFSEQSAKKIGLPSPEWPK